MWHRVDENSTCAHWQQAQQSCVSQRDKERSILYPCAAVQKM
ncbi:unnamed protein product [Gulo gulo]|uniref:Uncharacterized protein n=1 Tax=Gulo gulo TaxID=48420 RepID=A0A9X9PTT6_GULGU|nr:unnamed protein product [Gulo gulo]